MATHLPVVEEHASSLRSDGSRNWVHPADVKGRFTTLRRIIFAVLIAVYGVLPWVYINGHPALFLDIYRRKFYLFGLTFNAQDAWLAFFLVTGVGFGLFFLTAILGRAWCGYACPQTVFLEGVYRRIERWIEGPRNQRIRRNAGPLSFDKVWRKGLKHILFLLISALLAHVLISYFVSLPALFEMVLSAPAEHPEPFMWATGVTLALYLNFAFFREQLCLIVCPYGRLQSVLTDKDSIIVGYDEKRGEPRGKASDPEAGDCVSCNRCVVVCPTGIDIRNGLQLDCIGCANCVDACDEVMAKLGRPAGLVRYDSMEGLEHRPTRIIRPRLFLYMGLGLIGLTVMSFALQSRQTFEANLLRSRGASFVVTDDGFVRNSLEIHVVNKRGSEATFEISAVEPGEGHRVTIPRPEVTIDSLANTHVPVFVDVPTDRFESGVKARFLVRPIGPGEEGEGERRIIEAPLLGPLGPASRD